MDMNKTYNPKDFEDKLYERWETNGCFKADENSDKVPFTIVMPPPNITGQLHMGHALNNTIQDIIIRFKRMQGYETLWLPGTDHASIATEVKIVEQMKKEGLTKVDVGRDGFLERAWNWKKQYGDRIVKQLKKLGSSCDWSREAFTMDEKCSKAVKKVFVDLYNKGLIYQGDRIINWCPTCKTALSDAEVDYEEHNSNLWHIRYPVADGDGSIVVATTRPETMLGDTAVAVNPKDTRYKSLVGKMLKLPLTDRLIPVIEDEYVELDFGTGAVKITPAHDPNDFEVGLRHDLEVIRVMNDDGTMNSYAGAYEGMDRTDARKKIVEDLKAQGYLVKIEPHVLNAGHCYRCGSTVEPIVSKQWFVKMKPLAEPAVKAVKTKQVEFIPKRFEKIYFNWMENVRDWCISRQLWWGHRIPAYYCENCGETVVSVDEPKICPKCKCVHFKQDEDVLDTWFSSALWPFSTLGYPDKTKDLKRFYPNSLLVTAYDIIFFWVARMIFSGIAHMNEVPFSEVLIHGIVRDEQGRKMSKSLGNGVDPLEIIDKYGADTLRFSLAFGIAPGSDTRFIESKLESCRNFINKVWNASRFVIMNLENVKVSKMGEFRLDVSDKWILTRLNKVIREVTANISKYEIGLAASKLYDFVWSEFCDRYIELSKGALYSTDDKKRSDKLAVLSYVLTETLKLLHPFIPFVTEEIYGYIASDKTLMSSDWPKVNPKYTSHKDEAFMDGIMDIIRAVRNIRSELNVQPTKKVTVYLLPSVDVTKGVPYIEKLAGASSVEIVSVKKFDMKVTSAVTEFAEIFIPLGELIDKDKELARLNKELENVEKEIARGIGMLDNQNFISRAPAKLVDTEREKLKTNRELKVKLEKQIKDIRG